MRINGISINTDGSELDGSVARLEVCLAQAERLGFDGIELSLHGLDLIVGGRLNHRQLKRVRSALERTKLILSAHAPDRLNLAFPQRIPGCEPELDLEKDVFQACLQACEALGIQIMVYHSGLIALHEARLGLQSLPDDEALAHGRAQEVAALRELMPVAEACGVTVAMENRDPHPWEVAVLARAGVSHEDLPRYHAGMLIPALVEQVEAVDHLRFGLTLDLGHLYLAANYCRFDYLEAIHQAAPYVRHIHGSDNFGRLGGVFDEMHFRIPYGNGDVHMPHGWGNLPHREALAQLGDYEGLYVMEVRPRFRDHLPSALAFLRDVIAQVRG
jgi:sugar phosphate isomerase/epimerase